MWILKSAEGILSIDLCYKHKRFEYFSLFTVTLLDYIPCKGWMESKCCGSKVLGQSNQRRMRCTGTHWHKCAVKHFARAYIFWSAAGKGQAQGRWNQRHCQAPYLMPLPEPALCTMQTCASNWVDAGQSWLIALAGAYSGEGNTYLKEIASMQNSTAGCSRSHTATTASTRDNLQRIGLPDIESAIHMCGYVACILHVLPTATQSFFF